MAAPIEPPASVAPDAARLRALVAEVSPLAEAEVDRWLAHREVLLQDVARRGEAGEWAAVAYLDRVAATGLAPADAARLLDSAARAAEACGEVEVQRQVALDRLLLEATAQRGPQHERLLRQAEALLETLEADGHIEAAAAGWRAMARTSGGGDEFVALLRSARLHQQIGQPLREALLLVEAARTLGPDHGDADDVLARARAIADRSAHQVLQAMALDTAARFAAARGHVAAALPDARAALGHAAGTQLEAGARVLLSDLLVLHEAWPELEQVADPAVELAVRANDPVLGAMARRHLGLSLVHQGRHAEGSDLLGVALEGARQHVPDLVGPAAWALGAAHAALGDPVASRAAYAEAAAAFEAQGRLSEAAQAHFEAGERAWDADLLDAAQTHFAAAAQHASAAADLWVLAAAERGQAALRMVRGELDGGLGDLDAVSGLVAARAEELGHPDAHEWPDRLFVSVMRQGAALLAAGGAVHAAAQRCEAAADVCTGVAALILTADQGRFLAEAGKARGARRLLEQTLPHLVGEDLDPIRLENAAAWARTLAANGQQAEADLVWERFGPGAGQAGLAAPS